jgi:hypothetical protein
MQFNIPQFIDKEDKIVGPFTAKQLGWMFGGGAILLVLWNLLDLSAFILSAIVVAGIVGAFAFYRPYNQTFLSFLISLFNFGVRPKDYLWKRAYNKNALIIKKVHKKTTQEIKEEKTNKKSIDKNKITEISQILDNY